MQRKDMPFFSHYLSKCWRKVEYFILGVMPCRSISYDGQYDWVGFSIQSSSHKEEIMVDDMFLIIQF